MTKDQHLEDQEQKYQDSVNQSIAYDAAILILSGLSEAEALAKAKEISENQQAAANDPTGALGTINEAQSPIPPVGKEAQIAAISAKLFRQLSEE